MAALLPFFTYYGGKFRSARHYPAPLRPAIIEPFAGSAGYSLRYPDRDVLLVDLDPNIAQTWDYLIRATETEIAALPDLAPGETVDDLTVPPEARLLIGWWLNKGSATPKRRPSSFMLRYPEGGPYWGRRVRARIISQQAAIRHWRVVCGSYADVADRPATWFIDPPYELAGRHYRYGADRINYAHLADWCRSRSGQVIACEADDASWLPFRYLTEIDGMEGGQKCARARVEVVWTGATGVDV